MKEAGAVQASPARNRRQLRRLALFELAPLELEADSPVEAQILDAARRCLLQYGSSKLSMNDVARVAGVSRGTVYNRFTDRDNLLRAVVETFMRCLAEDLDFAMQAESAIDDQVYVAAECLLSYSAAEKATGMLQRSDEALVQTTGAEWVVPLIMEVIHRHLAVARINGEVRASLDLDQASEWIARILLSLTVFPGQTFNLERPDELKAFLTVHLLKGLG